MRIIGDPELIGPDGILQTMSLDVKNQDDHMKDAFKDLEVLMVRAGEMASRPERLYPLS
jgi:ESCRT-II complex subunit VPS36